MRGNQQTFSWEQARSHLLNWSHSSNILSVELALRAGVRRLCLLHNEHTCDDEALDQFLSDTRKYLQLIDDSSPLKIYLAYDGLEIEV